MARSAFPPTRTRTAVPPQSRSPGSKPGPEGRPRGSERREQSAAGLPLVGGGVPGPRQPRAPHRLVPEGAVVVDAAHDAHGRCARRPGARRRRAGSRAGRWRARGARAGQRFPGADPGRARSGPGLPGRDLKGPSPIPAAGRRARGGGLPGRPAVGHSLWAGGATSSSFPPFLVTRGRPPSQRTHKGEIEARKSYRISSGRSRNGEKETVFKNGGRVGTEAALYALPKVPQWLRKGFQESVSRLRCQIKDILRFESQLCEREQVSQPL